MNETTNETRAGEVSRRYAVTFRFSGRTYSQLAGIDRVLSAVAGCCW